MESEFYQFLTQELQSCETSWVMGEFGALGEMHHAGHPPTVRGLTLMTSHAGLRIEDRRFRPVAYETISGRPRQWLHGVAFCLPAEQATRSRRSTITDLGRDWEALVDDERGSRLFDLGLGLATVDFCIRLSEPSLIKDLTKACGTSLLTNAELFEGVRQASPHRVLLSSLARMEVWSKIPEPSGRPVFGSHTHLLPHLMNRQRAYSANLPIPDGWLPCLSMYPPHPTQDLLGRETPFDMRRHARFQELMHRFGTPQQVSAKSSFFRSLAAGVAPEQQAGRHARLAMRVAARQEAALNAFGREFDAPVTDAQRMGAH